MLTHLEALKCLSQEQLHLLEFWDVSTEMSRRCTKRLEDNHLIRRVKMKWAGTPDWFHLYDDKRPDQIQHRLGKAWICTAWNLKALDSQSNQRLTYFKSEEKRFFVQDEKLPVPDSYGVMNHKVYGDIFNFGEFQVLESGNAWDKDYRSLFKTFAEDQWLSLMIVTTGPNDILKQRLFKELSGMKNVRLEFYTLDRLKELCWRIALKMREEHRRKNVLTGRGC